MKNIERIDTYFTDYYEIDPNILENYGAYDISLLGDLPLFIDPFLLFQSDKIEYQNLHSSIIEYLKYLRDVSLNRSITNGRLDTLFHFKEVKQNYLGFCAWNNEGRGLGKIFANALYNNLSKLLNTSEERSILKSEHFEKLCLISPGVGRDMISDFTTNLIKEYLCCYTEKFAVKHIDKKYLSKIQIKRVKFDYKLEYWESKSYTLPIYNNSYVLLTPKDILTRDENWINRSDYKANAFQILSGGSNEELRSNLDHYLKKRLTEDATPKEINDAKEEFVFKNVQLIDQYIRMKEDYGNDALKQSAMYVVESENIFRKQFGDLISRLNSETLFYNTGTTSKKETIERINYLKDMIENKGCWTVLYNGETPISREEDIHVLFRLVWCRTKYDVSHEVNDGYGPADFKISMGLDKTVVEFKLASNTHLKRNLQNQVEKYKIASDAKESFTVIFYFTDAELSKVINILTELNLSHSEDIILIDARKKKSASKI
ncbi:hypothetical protein [Dehalococcoides mccartyi]|uniref:hypothetical protein n=1 Tax=Dehalococcoides mccartyi TaxID=61435 RepID=UPI00398B3505